MSRGQVRFVIALAVMLSLMVVGYYLITALREQKVKEKDLARIAQDVVPGADQRMQHFRRAKIRDGKKVWELAARQARYVQENNEIVVEEPEVSLYLQDGDVLALRCQEGRVHLGEDEDVTLMELKGDLEVRVNNFIITTQHAVYESEHNTISSPGPVRIVGQGLEVEGKGYTVEVAEKRVRLNADVQTTVTKGEGDVGKI
jgi:LPS export ABC transporter protein LptC